MTESKEHTEYTNQIASHIKSKLSSCPACVVDGLRSSRPRLLDSYSTQPKA